MHRYLSLDTLFERNKSLGSHNTRNTLQLVVEKRHELLVVAGIQFDEHSIWSCGEVTLHNLRDMNETLYHLLVHTTLLKGDTHVCARGISKALGIDVESTTHDDITIYQMLNSLMDGCTGNITLSCHILERDRKSVV